MINYFAAGQAYWRPYEKESCDRYFNRVDLPQNSDVLFWRLNTESVTENMHKQYLDFEKAYNGKIINPMSSFNFTRDKSSCFKIWESNGICTPKSFEFKSKDDFYSKLNFNIPLLLRLNDRATGENTYLIEKESDLEIGLNKVISDYNILKNHTTKMICVEFIDTKINDKNISFRIHVAGSKVISGYARISDDWLAISAKFTPDLKPAFIEQNKRVKRLIDENYDEIVNSVNILGLHHQGIDVIADSSDKLYFLEVQPFYFSGRPLGVPNPTKGPYWNPYKPEELVNWLINDEKNLYREIPYYYDNWLNKEIHFDNCYKALEEYVRS